jgi:hypothetical protein
MAISNTIGVTKLAMGIGDGGNSYIPRASFATTYHPPAWTRKVRQLESTSTVQTRSRIVVRDVSCWPLAPDHVLMDRGRYRSRSGHVRTSALTISVENDPQETYADGRLLPQINRARLLAVLNNAAGLPTIKMVRSDLTIGCIHGSASHRFLVHHGKHIFLSERVAAR